MASLTGQSVASSYEQLLHVDRDGGGNGTTLVNLKDGDNGTTFALQLATDKINVNGAATFTGSVVMDSYLTLKTTDDQANSWVLYTHTDDSFQLNYNGAGNAEVIVDNSGVVELSSGQLKFPASQNASSDANTLDDYEEGEHTATVVGATSGNFVVNSTFNKFRYTKIGRVVHIQGLIITDSDSSTSGSLRISLPFTIGDGSGGSERSFGSVALQGHGGTISGNLNAVLEPGSAFFEIVETQDSGATNTISESDVDSAFNIGVDFTYTV